MLRFAPSPTGSMHIGNLRVALLNFLVAKRLKLPLMVRIEDTDLERNIPGKDQEILEILEKVGITWNELIYQSANLPTHLSYAEKLLQNQEAFYCYCTPAFLEAKKAEALKAKKPFRYEDHWALLEKESNPNPVVRLKGSTQEMQFTDTIKGSIRFNAHELDSFVILRSNQTPTYNFACACDDFTYGISYIIRGEDHVSNTPKQMLIQQALSRVLNLPYKPTTYAHLPIILNEEDGKKMSKRVESSSVQWLLKQGFLPASIANYLISLGYKPPKEVFDLSEATTWFVLENVSASSAKFSLPYLRHLNHKRLQNLSLEQLAKVLQIEPFKAPLAQLFLEESSTLVELHSKLQAMFAPKDISKDYEGQNFYDQCLLLYNTLKTMPVCTDFSNFKQIAMQKSQLRGKDFFKPLRILLTGQSHGLELATLYPHVYPFLDQILTLATDHGC
ncbi:glutamate--tRNA ligase [Helicobacter suis]|uniref:Glutamate--tRNA ligase n=1 Tax=Helicobacter suis TaxID=104628 RepID=A0A6J4CXJ0_9HELI|nr:glutamate--tRNA ligase [Helicobacter suis]EFX42552.1 glutamyl-tRNA synthetase [Helicobacter suis HS1]BCD45901.1 Glutamylglutaminyl-tRNA synthetase GltX [Helicobacter suis]BCD49932.1 Glutamylglutaminyl-tRNA synthetase GltX [Helicobacter suis]BCD69895.1 Glutamylglutaminyl-tRNA synthetase GltX [Helicobacter suis]BDR28441.1 glutamylGlutaminyl-tRNA synthetase [Helicobacter suis HS1]